MTKVTVTKHNNRIIVVECDGHTGYGAEGEDIVCAALSSVVQTAALGLLQVAGVALDLQRDASKGYLRMELPRGLDDKTMHDCQVILNTMLLGVADLNEGFSDYVELEVR